MFRLKGGTHFLVLKKKGDKSLVQAFGRFDEALAQWDTCSRISPIFALDDAPAPNFPNCPKGWLLFVGPIYPADSRVIDYLNPIKHKYVALGLLNLVVFCTSEAEIDSLRKTLESFANSWEEWTIETAVRTHVDYHPPISDRNAPKEFSTPLRLDLPEITPTAREFQTSLATIAATAASSADASIVKWTNLISAFRVLLVKDDISTAEKLQSLVLSNVALSRHHWQTYAGSPPISENPSHLSTHSLLGIGSASIALTNLCHYLETVYDEFMIADRVMHLRNVPPVPNPLIEMPAHDPFWDSDHLFPSAPPFVPDTISRDPNNPIVPPMTYFSGRDGFRSTGFSLTAPIEAITGCNTHSWTLQTLTHELSHSVVRSVLGRLLPAVYPIDHKQLSRIMSLLKTPTSALSLFEQIQAFLLYGIWRMKEAQPTEIDISQLPDRIRTNAKDCDEIITHVFDFLYHYRNDYFHYIKCIWLSWGTIPHIEDRIDDYIVRTLCAIHSANLRRADGMKTTIDSARKCLEDVHFEMPDAPYISQGIDALTQKTEYFHKRLKSRVPLIKFARYFLWSHQIAGRFTGETEAVLSESFYHSHQFSDLTISNPLRFIAECSRGKFPDPIKSVWILQHLAHGLSK